MRVIPGVLKGILTGSIKNNELQLVEHMKVTVELNSLILTLSAHQRWLQTIHIMLRELELPL